ncbi:MAG: TlpA disulfide reductase family protein [Weeksellaceae bacterium]|nr:TlpA disulfide reductase family protein [Weeksellaceae bacterium]
MKNNKIFTAVFCLFIMVFGMLTAVAQTESLNLKEISLKLNDNSIVKVSDLKGKVVLIDFWYRGCFPCLKAIPDLIKLQEEFKGDLVIIGINDIDIKEDVIDYFDYKNVNYLSTYKTSYNISKNFKIKAFPTTILYDKQGNVIQTDTGYNKTGIRKLRKAIKTALK